MFYPKWLFIDNHTCRTGILNFLSQMLSLAELSVQGEFGLCSTAVSCYSVYSTNSKNSDNTHQTYEIIGISECAECVCLYKPVRSLALFFPSVVSGIKKTKGEKSVSQLIQTAPHRHIPERESLTCKLWPCTVRGKDSNQEKKETGCTACNVFLHVKE